MFGIKATNDWTGKTVDAVTTEYVNGKPQRVVEKFRAYDSYEDAMTDYASVLKSNPRYAQVMKPRAMPPALRTACRARATRPTRITRKS